jgi:cold-inducible RNA-binding protein
VLKHLQRFSWRFFVATKLYVGNLPFNVTEEEVKEYFSTVGEVQSVKIISDRDTGRSRGFCFVEMQNADAAITDLNGKEMNGRKITVSEAREREQRSGGSGGFQGGGGGGGFKKRFNGPRN